MPLPVNFDFHLWFLLGSIITVVLLIVIFPFSLYLFISWDFTKRYSFLSSLLFWEPPAKLRFQYQIVQQLCPNRKWKETGREYLLHTFHQMLTYFHLANGLTSTCLSHNQGVPHIGNLFILADALWLLSDQCLVYIPQSSLWHREPDFVFFQLL